MLTMVATNIAQQSVETGAALAPPVVVWRTLGSLVLVIALLLGCNLLFKRKLGSLSRTASQRRMRIVERLAIGHRHSLVLIDVDDERLVLGVTPDRITALANTPQADTSFSAKLSQAAELEAS